MRLFAHLCSKSPKNLLSKLRIDKMLLLSHKVRALGGQPGFLSSRRRRPLLYHRPKRKKSRTKAEFISPPSAVPLHLLYIQSIIPNLRPLNIADRGLPRYNIIIFRRKFNLPKKTKARAAQKDRQREKRERRIFSR